MQPALVGYESRAGYKRVAGSQRGLPVCDRCGQAGGRASERLGTGSARQRRPGTAAQVWWPGTRVRSAGRAGCQRESAAHVAGDLGRHRSGGRGGETTCEMALEAQRGRQVCQVKGRKELASANNPSEYNEVRVL